MVHGKVIFLHQFCKRFFGLDESKIITKYVLNS